MTGLLQSLQDYGFVDVTKAQDIAFLYTIVYRCMLSYQNSRGQLPDRVIIYRGGTSDGQHASVLKFELPLMQKALREAGSEAHITLITHSRKQPLRLFQKSVCCTFKGCFSTNGFRSLRARTLGVRSRMSSQGPSWTLQSSTRHSTSST